MWNQINQIRLFGAGPFGLVLAGKNHCPIVVNADSLDGIARQGAEPVAAQQGGECLAEISVEGINDGVEGRIGPSKPYKNIKGGGVNAESLCSLGRLGGLAEGNHAVQHKKWQPAAHKHPHDHRESLQHLRFPLEGHFEVALWLLAVHAAPVATRVVAVLGVHCCSLQSRDAPDLLLSNPVYPGVGHYHDGHGDVEAN